MSASAITAGQVAIKAQVANVNQASQDLNRLDRNLAKIEKTTKGASAAMKAFGKFISVLVAVNVIQRNIGKLNKMIRESVDAIDALDKGSKRLGITAQQYRTLGLSVQMAGGTIEQFETAFMSMQRNIANLSLTPSGGEAKTALEQLGIDLEELKRKSPEERLFAIAGALDEFGKHGDRAGIAMKIFGEGGAKILPFLDQGEKGMREFAQRMQSVIGTLEEGTIDKFVDLRDATTLWNASIETAQANLMSNFVPAMIDVMAGLVGVTASIDQTLSAFDNLGTGVKNARSEVSLTNATIFTLNTIVSEVSNKFNALYYILVSQQRVNLTFVRDVEEMVNALARLGAALSNPFFRKGFEEFAEGSDKQLEIFNQRIADMDAEIVKSADRFGDLKEASTEGLVAAKDRAAEFKGMLESIMEVAKGAKKEFEGFGKDVDPDKAGGIGEKLKKITLSMAKAFSGEAIKVGTASAEVEIKGLMNQHLEVLKRIEENTGSNVIVGV